MSGGLHSWIHTAHLVALTVMFVATNSVIGRELPTASSAPDTSSFYRGVNLNGPPVVIDGNQWEGHQAKWLQCNDRAFENQLVPLDPPTDPERTKMIRSSRWGGNEVTINDIPPGRYTVYLYVWEDNDPEIYHVSINGAEVLSRHNSGQAGHWDKLGPWLINVKNQQIKITSKGGAANFSGIEVWQGERDSSTEPSTAEAEFFEKRIRPLLVNHCYECHSSESNEVQGRLLVDSRSALRKGGDRGAAIVPGDLELSLLIKAVRYGESQLQMPPDRKLADHEIADLEHWVKMGAPDPRTRATKVSSKTIDLNSARSFWSYRPLVTTVVPTPTKSTARNEIDSFIEAELEKRELTPLPLADKRTLIRRATFDLTGLPPTPEEIDAFLEDSSEDAFESVINRLLESPHYGERWGRHWLDVVRYSDSAGDNSDFPIPQMYLYRNWVIDAFNRDLPYDQFVREQLAGDLMESNRWDERNQRVIATGYLANARRFGSRVDDYPTHLTIEDTIDNLGRTFLGQSINCARCHDHKFDPITIDDYYGLYGFFSSTRYPWPGIELDQMQRDLVPLVPAEQARNALIAHQNREKELEAELARLEKELSEADNANRSALNQQVAAARKQVNRHKKTLPDIPYAYAVAEGTQVDNVAIQFKGNPETRGEVVRRRFPTVLGGQELSLNDLSSGRMALADWIVDPANPLTSRVMVNRIWLRHFGRGLVTTPNEFGKQGKPPSNPALLDWLASRFIESGWSIKSMHRLIMQSRTYQTESVQDPATIPGDPANEFLSGFPRNRLDAETIRDTLLFVGGNLDTRSGGPHPFPPSSEWDFTQHHPFKAIYETNQRSVYLMTQRIQRHPYLAIFDGPDTSVSTPQRSTSTTPLQSLYFMNNSFVHQQAELVAARLRSERSDDSSRIDLVYVRLLGRPPRQEERSAGLHYLKAVKVVLAEAGKTSEESQAQAWVSYVRSLFLLNEFVYVD
ncbi:DUF1553 domain-containing protein [Schlesneria sp. DSM 10557]|uniref:PSD1 and planctomycete cytochrome C domain-containing protein n=1 Tax=Schlesneria sp. DSM 10557 TaxID=3044399 RepID=UPI00359F44F5